MKMRKIAILLLLAVWGTMGMSVNLLAATLKVGTAKTDITPEKAVPLWGQFGLRLSQGVLSPITANVCAIEAFEEGGVSDAAILVSVDVVACPDDFTRMVRDKAVARDSSIVPEKILLLATHTHTAPVLYVGPRLPAGDNIEDYPETIDAISSKIAEAICAAWKSREPSDFSWGLEQVVIGESRRAVYFNGEAQMYGDPTRRDFSHYENPSDPDLGTLFFWDKSGKLIAVVVNVACTSQEVEGLSVLAADYWHTTREKLNERFGSDVVVVGCNAPAGDNSPHPQYRKAALERMRRLRHLDSLQEIARRIDRAVADSYDVAVNDKQTDVVFAHHFARLDLPMRAVTDDEYRNAKEKSDSFKKALADNPEKSPAEVAFMAIRWYGNVVDRYESAQQNGIGTFSAPVHVLRIGDVVLATNQFEMFVDYSMRIKARSPAVATFVIDLADGDSSYLPTTKAIAGGGYSAVVESDLVSPEGGQKLVEETLSMIRDVWK